MRLIKLVFSEINFVPLQTIMALITLLQLKRETGMCEQPITRTRIHKGNKTLMSHQFRGALELPGELRWSMVSCGT